MDEIQDLRREVSMALDALEEKKSALIMERLDLENRTDDIIIGLTNSMCVWVVVSSLILLLHIKFLGGSIWLIIGAALMLAVGWANAYTMARRKIRWMTGFLEDLEEKKASLIEDAEQFAIKLQKSQKKCQSKVMPVIEDVLVNNGDGVANISSNTNWLARQEFLEKRFEHVRTWHDYGDFEGDRLLFIKWIAIVGTFLLSCFAVAWYYFYGR